MINLFAICRGEKEIFEIPIAQDLSPALINLFKHQEDDFKLDKQKAVPFSGKYKAENDEFYYLNDRMITKGLHEAINDSSVSIPLLDLKSDLEISVRGIFTKSIYKSGLILVQQFKKNQYLQRGVLSLIYSNRKFNKLNENGFSLNTHLAAVIEENKIYFRNFRVLREIFNVHRHMVEATEAEIDLFSKNKLFVQEDNTELKVMMNERERILVKSILDEKTLNDKSVSDILNVANKFGLTFNQSDGKLIIPKAKEELRNFLSMLDDFLFIGEFTGEVFRTNSKTQITPKKK